MPAALHMVTFSDRPTLPGDAQLLDGIVTEVKLVPYVICSLGLLFMMEIGLAADRITLHREFTNMEYTLKHDHLDSRLHASESEQFSLSQKVIEIQRQGKDVDPLNTQRLEELKNMHVRLINQLHDLEQGHPSDEN